MGQCELCGQASGLSKAVIEGALLSVCRKCISFGNAIEIGTAPSISRRKIDLNIPLIEEEIILDYAEKIKVAREKNNMTQEFLAKALAEKERVIQKIEACHAEPSLALARKIEHFLNIQLIEKIELKSEKKTLELKDNSMTIGDLIKLAKK